MDESYFQTTPSIRASIAASRANASSITKYEVVFVQRTGPRILNIPSEKPKPLGAGTLDDLRRGKLSQELTRGRRIAGSRMMACADIEVEKNGSYTLKKADAAYKNMKPITVNTLDVWTGEVGTLREDIDINNLTFYSLEESLLPSYHSWKDHDAKNELNEMIKPDLDLSLFDGADGTGKYIDLVDEQRAAAAAEKIANDPEEKLRIKPSIKSSDEAWQEIEEFFRWILEDELKNPRPQISRLIRKEFNEAQRLLLYPAAATSVRFQIQAENTERYQEALRTTFATKKDDLVTKLTMLCFGLPIAPITSTNIKYAGSRDDVPGKVPGDAFEKLTRRTQTILWSEKPLEFLDVYNKRSYGYPMIRMKKRPHNAIDTKSADDDLRLAEILKRQAKFPWKSRRFGCGQSFRRRKEAPELHLRGGGGEPAAKHRKHAAYKSQKINVYTEMGRFEIGTYQAFQNLLVRLFRTPVSRFNFDIDIFQDAPPGLDYFTEVIQSFKWSYKAPESFDWNKLTNYISKEEAQGKYKLRVRQGGNIRELYEPEASDPDLVEIFLQDVGVVYWHLPVNRGEIIGTNQYQDTFRNAIECLLPNHRQHIVHWELESKTTVKKQGQLVLVAEAPSKDLWDEILVQLNARISRVRIYLTIILKKELASTIKTQFEKVGSGSEGELIIVVPGSANIAISPLFRGYDHEEFLERIRKTVHARTSPRTPAIRLWSGPENYCSEDEASRFVIFPPTKDKEDSGLLLRAGIILTADAIVARPEFSNFRVVEVQNEENSTSWDPQKVMHDLNHYSLDSFYEALRKLWPGYTTKEYVVIIQSKSNDKFIIGPEMTDLQWRLQIFDWLDDENVRVQRNVGSALIYKSPCLKGPLGVTYSLGMMPTEAERRVQTIGSITAPTLETKLPAVVTPREATSRATWNSWVKKQDEAHEERVAAFTSDPSIYRRGIFAVPDISIFGQPFEYGISAGSLFPTIFTQMKTPAQVNELQRQTRRLENIVLDRIQSCQICSFTFPHGSIGDESKRKHLQEHINALTRIEKAGIGKGDLIQDLDTRPPSMSREVSLADGVDPKEDQKSIPNRLKEANPGKNFYCPVCYKLLGKQASPCNWHRKNCQVFGHENWLILTAQEMKARKGGAIPSRAAKVEAQGTEQIVPKKRSKPDKSKESNADGEPSAKKAKRSIPVKPIEKPRKRNARVLRERG